MIYGPRDRRPYTHRYPPCVFYQTPKGYLWVRAPPTPLTHKYPFGVWVGLRCIYPSRAPTLNTRGDRKHPENILKTPVFSPKTPRKHPSAARTGQNRTRARHTAAQISAESRKKTPKTQPEITKKSPPTRKKIYGNKKKRVRKRNLRNLLSSLSSTIGCFKKGQNK